MLRIGCARVGNRMAGRRGFGRLRKGRSGKWQAGYTGLDGRIHYAPTTFETADDARIWLRLEQRQMEADPEAWMPPKERLALKDANRPPLFSDHPSATSSANLGRGR